MNSRSIALSSVLFVCLVIVASTGCGSRRAARPPTPVDASGAEISEDTLRTLVVSLNKRYENVDSRIAENRQKIEALEKELTSLRQSVGILGPARRPATAEKVRNRVLDDKSTKGSPPSSLTASPSDPRKLYDTAFKAYSQGNFPTAISRFQEFINIFPSSDLADNAFYWIGESYYAQEDFERAISSFLNLVDRYPDGNKVPDGLFKIGLSYIRMNSPAKAREFLTRVMDNYPFSDAAAKAKARLDELE